MGPMGLPGADGMQRLLDAEPMPLVSFGEAVAGGGGSDVAIEGFGGSMTRQPWDRRRFVAAGVRAAGALGVGVAAGAWAFARGRAVREVWQIDPDACMACGNCQTHCVLDISAVKAVNCFARCGYCDECTGYFPTAPHQKETGAENHLCPVDAVIRRFIEAKAGTRYFEYTIDENKCIGCGKCVLGCRLMNGSMYLQVRHDRCLNCNECAIAVACPKQAFRRVPADSPNLLPHVCAEAEAALAAKRRR